MTDYCDAFKNWLKSDRKQPPYCQPCAEANSLRLRAFEDRRLADEKEKLAEEKIIRRHVKESYEESKP
jgi:hypothetical protein